MSALDVDAALAAELAVLRAEHVALTREHQWLETDGRPWAPTARMGSRCEDIIAG